MANFNSAPAYLKESREGLQESIGITRFYGAHGWVHISAGLIRQGGLVSRTGEDSIRVTFNESFPKQVLGIFTCPAISQFTQAASDLTGFTTPSGGGDVQFYWEAIGI